jgi:hypothetical protein
MEQMQKCCTKINTIFDSDGFVLGTASGVNANTRIIMFLGTGKQMVLEYQTQMALLHLL